MKLITFDPAIKKVVVAGKWIPEKKLFAKKVGPEHFMRVLQGYGIQNDVFQQVVKNGVHHIAFKEIHTGDVLLSRVQQWLDDGVVKDYGHGKQRFLSIKFMRRKPHKTQND